MGNSKGRDGFFCRRSCEVFKRDRKLQARLFSSEFGINDSFDSAAEPRSEKKKQFGVQILGGAKLLEKCRREILKWSEKG